MHLKNWSLLYPDTRTPVLSPAYDFVSTLPYIPGDNLALTLGGSREMSLLSLDQIRRLSERAGMPMDPVVRIVSATADAMIEAWRSLPSKDLLPAATLSVIEGQIAATGTGTLAAVIEFWGRWEFARGYIIKEGTVDQRHSRLAFPM